MARPPDIGQNRDRYLRVRLSERESYKLDRIRAEKTRSDFVRELIAQAEDPST